MACRSGVERAVRFRWDPTAAVALRRCPPGPAVRRRTHPRLFYRATLRPTASVVKLCKAYHAEKPAPVHADAIYHAANVTYTLTVLDADAACSATSRAPLAVLVWDEASQATDLVGGMCGGRGVGGGVGGMGVCGGVVGL